MSTILHGSGQRFQLQADDYDEKIVDTKNNIQFCVLCQAGHGVPSSITKLFEEWVDHLNANHSNDKLYPEQ